MRVVFILGSGASVDAGMPSVTCITDQVNLGDGVWRHTSGVYVLDGANPNYELYRPRVVPILRLIANVQGRIEASGHRVALTYEEIAFVLQQIRDALSGEYENPAVLPFADQLLEPGGLDRKDLQGLCDDALDYVTDTVAALLHRGDLDHHAHLGAIVEACRAIGHVDLATLNHDLLLEAALEANGVRYTDGFEGPDQDVRFWTDVWRGAPVRVLKLHGSVDWFDFRCATNQAAGWIPARYVGKDREHPSRCGVELRSSHPIVLSGTFTKILGYQTGLFPDVHARFHEGLREAERVVVIGYGFGDKAINTHLIRWLARVPTNRMVICHSDPDGLRSGARQAIRNHWYDWAEDGRLVTIPVFVNDLDFEALVAALAG